MKSNPTVSRPTGHRSVQGWLIAGLAAAVTSFAGCGGGGGGGGGSSIADFGNTFLGFEPSAGYDANAQRVSLNLFPDSASQNKPSGSFDASISALRLFNPTQVPPDAAAVSGTFSGTTFVIHLTNPPAPIASSYDGHFSEVDTIVLTNGGSTLTLRRDGGTFTANVATSTWTGSDASGTAWVVNLDLATGYDTSEPTFLIQGSESLNGGAPSSITGYVSNRYIEFHIARSAGTVVLTGQFPVASGTVNGDLMEFDAGGSLMRSGVAAFSLKSQPNPSLFMARGLGQKQTRISSVTGPDAWVWAYAVSPNRTRVAYTASSSRDDLPQVFLYTAASGSRVQLTRFGAGTDYAAPVWSANSAALAFVTPATLGAAPILYVEKAGTNNPIQLSNARSTLGTFAWSPDSTQIAYLADQDTLNQVELYVVGADGRGWHRLSGSIVNPAERVIDWGWSPHGGTIRFRADGTTPGVFERYSVSTSLSGEP
jgi:hypothetical protein